LGCLEFTWISNGAGKSTLNEKTLRNLQSPAFRHIFFDWYLISEMISYVASRKVIRNISTSGIGVYSKRNLHLKPFFNYFAVLKGIRSKNDSYL